MRLGKRLLCWLLVLSTASIVLPLLAQESECDSFGNCLGLSIEYVRSNPDGSLFVGDQIRAFTAINKGPNTTSFSFSWHYDSDVFQARVEGQQAVFESRQNRTSFEAIVASATFYVSMGNRTISNTIAKTFAVELRAFPLRIDLKLVNMTTTEGQIRRNPYRTLC